MRILFLPLSFLLLLLCLCRPASAARVAPPPCTSHCSVPVSYCLPDTELPEPDSWLLLAGLAVCVAGRLAARR